MNQCYSTPCCNSSLCLPDGPRRTFPRSLVPLLLFVWVGIIHSTGSENNQDCKSLILELVEHDVTQENTIIVTAISAKDDFNNQVHWLDVSCRA